MYYIGIYTHRGMVQVTNTYVSQETLHRNQLPGSTLLCVCESPTSEGLDAKVKEALKRYEPLPGLPSPEQTFELSYTVTKRVRVAGSTEELRNKAGAHLRDVYKRALENEGYVVSHSSNVKVNE